MTGLTWMLCCLALLAAIETSQAVECHVCSGSSACTDPFNTGYTESSRMYRATGCKFCTKSKAVVGDYQEVYRECEYSGTIPSTTCEKYEYDYQGIKVGSYACYCSGDLCNGATYTTYTVAGLVLATVTSLWMQF